MKTTVEIQTLSPATRNAWRRWLQKNHKSQKSVSLIIYKLKSSTKSILYEDAIEEALCFGWIDSTRRTRDAESYFQLFAQRNPNSKWSKLNRDRVKKLMNLDLMTDAGMAAVEAARKNGNWKSRIESQNLVIPAELQKAFSRKKTAWKNFEAFPPSSKRIIVEWIQNAKREETRKKRIKESVRLAGLNIRANQVNVKLDR